MILSPGIAALSSALLVGSGFEMARQSWVWADTVQPGLVHEIVDFDERDDWVYRSRRHSLAQHRSAGQLALVKLVKVLQGLAGKFQFDCG
jgi:hypothetical protein